MILLFRDVTGLTLFIIYFLRIYFDIHVIRIVTNTNININTNTHSAPTSIFLISPIFLKLLFILFFFSFFLFLLSSFLLLFFQAAYTDLEQVAWDLKTAQMEAGVDFPVHLSREAGGLVRYYTVSSIDVDFELHGFMYFM